jgi:phosphoglycolate phosphatase
MPIKLVIFDFDGTLASSIEGITVCMSEALLHFGFTPPSRDEVRSTIGLTLEDSIRKLTNGTCPESDIPEVVRAYRNFHDTKAATLITLFDGAIDALAAIKAAGIKCVLVSNKGRAGLAQLLNLLKISDYFDLTLAADSVQHRKPSSVLYTTDICPVFPFIDPRDILVVGDTESDLRFATNIGAQSCWAAYGYGDGATCAALLPTFTISNVSELQGLLW